MLAAVGPAGPWGEGGHMAGNQKGFYKIVLKRF